MARRRIKEKWDYQVNGRPMLKVEEFVKPWPWFPDWFGAWEEILVTYEPDFAERALRGDAVKKIRAEVDTETGEYIEY